MLLLANDALPTSQAVHPDAPVEGWYSPTEHGEHEVAPSSEYPPAEQKSEHGVLRPRAVENDPAAQEVQPDAPVEGWYWPAAHDGQIATLPSE